MVLFISLLQSVIIARIIECHETHFPRPTAERLRHDSDVWCEGAEESTLLCMLDTHVQTKDMRYYTRGETDIDSS